MSKSLTLGIVFSSMGAGAVATTIGTVVGHLGSIEKKVVEAKSRMKELGLETVDAFAVQKKELQQAKEQLQAHQTATTSLGRSVAMARIEQEAATESLQAYRTELAGQTGRATDEQRVKLKTLREQVSQADRNLKELTKEFKEARDKGQGMTEGVMRQTERLQRLRTALEQNGVSTRNLSEHRRRITQAMRNEQATVDRLTTRYERLKAAQNAQQQARADLNSRWGDAMAAYGTARALGAPVGAFIRQDDALNSLQVAMMDKNGQVGGTYDALKRQAIELGNLLPGTTADFVGTARALMEQGVAVESVLGGGLKAASYLSVVLRMPTEEAGEMAAKLREAYKLSDDELTKMADSMQRAKFAFGMKPSDLMAASAYQAPMLNQLGISGIDNTNKMLAIQGMAAQVGLEGSSFGTNFSMMLSRLAKGPQMIEDAKKGMKGHAKGLMEDAGITFDFFDKKGNFAGLDHMVTELEKLKTIKDKLGDKAAMEVAEAMFGAEAGRPAMILAEQGMAGFRAAQERMAQQASLQQRIERTTQSSKNTIEALGGSLENLGAALAGPVVQALHPLINVLNTATGWLTEFADSNPRATKALGFLVLGLGAAITTFFALGVAMSFGRVLVSGLQVFSLMTRIGGGAAWLGGVLRGPLLGALGVARVAVIALGRAMLMNPIGLIITGIAAGAYLVYRYWTPIKGFFLGLWSGIRSGFVSAWNGVTSIFTGIWNQITSAFSGGIAGVGKLIVNWSPMGLFYKAFSGVLSWFGVDLPKNFTDFGTNIISGLTNGIKSAIGGAVTAIGDFASGLKSKFTNLLGIQSPSRVFMGFGGNIGDGAALGILKSVPGVQGAAGRLAGVALAGAVAASNTAVAGVNSSIQTRQPVEPPRLEAPAAQVLRLVAPATMPRVELPRMGVPRLDVSQASSQAASPAPMPQAAPALAPQPTVSVTVPRIELPRLEAPRQADASQPARPAAPVVMPQMSMPRAELPRQVAPMPIQTPMVSMPPLPRIELPRLELPGLNMAALPAARLVASVPMPQANAPSPVRFELPRLESPMQAAQPVVPAAMQRAGEVNQVLSRRESAPSTAASAGVGQGGMTIHFSPSISVGGDNGGGDVRGQVQEGLKLSMRELEQMIRRLQAEQQRRAF
ncbi:MULTISPECIES: phage tail tape measure protein [Pseudomonadota]|uniref:phage tail tape measure protein n=1 Tax=Pseudomonadota TaxID=1224 RepID=UPI001BCC6160|nr:phage tail tape measure protein [Citrobacter europaeus]ELQ8315422.1 phage tail tape measure protein [Pseudomonas aeruginosa]MCU3413365.1 phage tail tape measure protein [Enterobacter hormaechei subsp. steigerwaltii]